MKPSCLALCLVALLTVACGETTRAEPQVDAENAPSTTSAPVNDARLIANSTEDDEANRRPLFAEHDGPMDIYWDDLLPEGEEEILVSLYLAQRMAASSIAEGAPDDIATQIGTFNVVEDLGGEKVRLAGFAVPLDFSARTGVKEFLLVPSFGQCLHNPPPPPNQTVFVRAAEPIRLSALDDPVMVSGTLVIERTDSELASAAYVIEVDEVERFRGRR